MEPKNKTAQDARERMLDMRMGMLIGPSVEFLEEMVRQLDDARLAVLNELACIYTMTGQRSRFL